jgi:hypothetical protein
MFVEFLVSFLMGFLAYWFVSNSSITLHQKICPMKDSIIWIAKNSPKDSKKIMREIREFSLVKIGEGHYEYEDVLNTLIMKDRNDKS